MSTQLSMEVLREEVVAPAGHFAAELRKGQVLRIVDLKGQQVADLVTLNAANLSEKLSVMNTINLNKQVFPRVGYVLYSDEARGMTIIADTCGVQDMLAGACSSFTNCPIGNDATGRSRCRKAKPAATSISTPKWAAFSNFPQVHNACNGFRLKPLKAVIYEYSPY